MNKNEILKLLNSYKKEPYGFSDYKKDYGERDDLKSNDFHGFISEPWIIGGATGGNCWNDNGNEPIDAEPEKKFEILDNFLIEHCPNITFSQYRTLEAYINEQEYRVIEYYGNYNKMKIKYIKFNDLVNFIQKNNIEVINHKKTLKPIK